MDNVYTVGMVRPRLYAGRLTLVRDIICWAYYVDARPLMLDTGLAWAWHHAGCGPCRIDLAEFFTEHTHVLVVIACVIYDEIIIG